jgi:hypothetical protein
VAALVKGESMATGPKATVIHLTDPVNKEMYKRTVMAIACITICVLGSSVVLESATIYTINPSSSAAVNSAS